MSVPPGGQPPPWGHPGAVPPPPQQVNYGFQGGSYGGFGAFAEQEDVRPPRRKGMRITVGILAVTALLAAAGGAAWSFGLVKFGDVLDETSVKAGVRDVLANHYGESNVDNLNCPPNQEVRTGHRFTCTAHVEGKHRKIEIRVLNDKPQFEVGAPR